MYLGQLPVNLYKVHLHSITFEKSIPNTQALQLLKFNQNEANMREVVSATSQKITKPKFKDWIVDTTTLQSP